MTKKQFWCYLAVVAILLFASIALVSLPPQAAHPLP